MLKDVFPNKKRQDVPKPLPNNVETFNEREAKKQSHTFVSGSRRTDMAEVVKMSDPGLYDVESA
jgi:hypothetical protein